MRIMYFVVAIVAIYALLVAAVFAFQEKLVFFPTRNLAADPLAIGLAFEDVHVGTEDGVTLHGWFVPAENARGTVLFFHGNAGNISHRLETIALINRLGMSLLIFDYRGYGLSTGKPSVAGTRKDAQAMWRYMISERGIEPSHIVLWGRSLGGAVAAGLAVDVKPAALILESTFTSVVDMGRRHYPFLPVGLIAKGKYPTIKHVPELKAPLLVVHSPDDEVVPFAMGRRLYTAATEPKNFLEISGSHNSGFLQSGEQYVDGVNRFISPVLGGSGH